MKAWIRHHKYALRTALQRLHQNSLSSLANIVVIALVLSVPIIGSAILQASQPLVRELAIQPEITLFLNKNINPKEQQDLIHKINAEEYVTATKFIDHDDALKLLQDDPSWSLALQALDSNPLPDAIVITLADDDNIATIAKDLTAKWQELAPVEYAQLDGQWVQRLGSLLSFIKFGLGFLALAVAIVVLATVFNTVRLQALSQREEITVARLVGATETFVRRPFLYLGAITSLIAFSLALVIAQIALIGLNNNLSRLSISYGIDLALKLPNQIDLLLSALVITILGSIAARLSVTRNKI